MTHEAYTEVKTLAVPRVDIFEEIITFVKKYEFHMVFASLLLTSAIAFLYFYNNGLALAYNDARSHLDIGRRVVEGLKPGLAQIGSVWLPLPHFLMIFTIWNDFMWHSGLSGALFSMFSFVGSGLYIWKILKKLNVGMIGRLAGVFVFAANANVLYLQSTAMTELLFIFTFCAAFYELICWYKSEKTWDLVKAAFWVMLSTLTRYDAWFILIIIVALVTLSTYLKRGYKTAEGILLLFTTLGGFGILLWLGWNYLIFGDPLFSFFGPYSAHAQQKQIYEAGELITRGSIFQSVKIYSLAIYHTIGLFNLILASIGIVWLLLARNTSKILKFVIITLLLSPLIYNILALFLGHSIISIVHVFGDNWFNVRYGTVMVPSVAICIGYLLHKVNVPLKYMLIPSLFFAYVSSFFIQIPVTIQDALWGASSKNVSQVSRWLKTNASNNEGLIFISAGSHDAIIFSSGFKMGRFIHEGTGQYWENASQDPDRWVRYIVMRTYDMKDATFFALKDNPDLSKYNLVVKGEFADIYELKGEYKGNLLTTSEMLQQDVNSKNQNKSQKAPKIDQYTSGKASVYGLASVFGIASTALFMAQIEGTPGRKKPKKYHMRQGKINSEFGSNLVMLREVGKSGFDELG